MNIADIIVMLLLLLTLFIPYIILYRTHLSLLIKRYKKEDTDLATRKNVLVANIVLAIPLFIISTFAGTNAETIDMVLIITVNLFHITMFMCAIFDLSPRNSKK